MCSSFYTRVRNVRAWWDIWNQNSFLNEDVSFDEVCSICHHHKVALIKTDFE